MTEEAFGEIPAGEGFDLMDPANNSPVVVALCADEAQDITGQCFFVYGGAVNVLQPWDAGRALRDRRALGRGRAPRRAARAVPPRARPGGDGADDARAGGRSLSGD